MNYKQRKKKELASDRTTITIEQIREWYKKNYGKLESGDITEGDDICNIIWLYEKSRTHL